MNGWGICMHISYIIQGCTHVFHGLYLPYDVLQYCWIKPAATEPQKASGPKRRALLSTVKGKAFRIGIYIYFSCFSQCYI